MKRQTIRTAGLALVGLAIAFSGVRADDDSRRNDRERHESHNYIIERQESGAVEGQPTSRRIIGKREIDVYSNGLMFEGNAVVGVEPRR